ncbi:hypothetical protein HC891_15325 [Candidatus Gracilibacteria bacterium]|nr:hypothetical protein [Candidatus Gracilibacteria bacterium]
MSDDPLVTQPAFPGLPQDVVDGDEQADAAAPDAVLDEGPASPVVRAAAAPDAALDEGPLSTPVVLAGNEAGNAAVNDRVLDLFKISSYLISVLDAEELQRNLVSSVAEALPSVHSGILWLFDAQKGRLRVASIYKLPLEAQTRKEFEQCQLRIGEGAAGAAVQRGELRLIETRLGYRDSAPHLSPPTQLLFNSSTTNCRAR